MAKFPEAPQVFIETPDDIRRLWLTEQQYRVLSQLFNEDGSPRLSRQSAAVCLNLDLSTLSKVKREAFQALARFRNQTHDQADRTTMDHLGLDACSIGRTVHTRTHGLGTIVAMHPEHNVVVLQTRGKGISRVVKLRPHHIIDFAN